MEKPMWLKSLRFLSRITSIVMLIVYLFYFFILVLMYNRISMMDFVFFVAAGSIYPIGILISFFREGLGGLIILGFIVFFVAIDILGTTYIDDFLSFSLVSMPGILNIFSWYYHKELDKNVV